MPGEGKRFHGGGHMETDPQRARKLPMGQQEAEGESPRVVQEQTTTPRDLSDPGTEPRSPALQADALPYEPPGK